MSIKFCHIANKNRYTNYERPLNYISELELLEETKLNKKFLEFNSSNGVLTSINVNNNNYYCVENIANVFLFKKDCETKSIEIEKKKIILLPCNCPRNFD